MLNDLCKGSHHLVQRVECILMQMLKPFKRALGAETLGVSDHLRDKEVVSGKSTQLSKGPQKVLLKMSPISTELSVSIFVKFAEFDEIMHSDPENLKNIVSKVLTWLVRTRWRRAIWGTLSVIKRMLKLSSLFHQSQSHLIYQPDRFTQFVFAKFLQCVSS